MIRCVHYLRRIRLEDGGVVRAVLDFCRVFAQQGNPTTLVTGDATDVPAEWREAKGAGLPKVMVIDAPRGPLKLLSSSAKAQLKATLGEADVLHLHAPWETSNVQVAAAARRVGVPYVLSSHGMLDDWSMAQRRLKKRVYLALAGNRLLRGAARVHCTAEGELDQARKWLPAGKGVVLPLIIDLSAYAELPGAEVARAKFPSLRSGRRTLLFLSRVHPKKGVEILIHAAAGLRKRGTPWNVVIAGPGDAEYVANLKQLAANLGLANSIEFPGMVRGPEKLSLYQAADLFVLPTSQENFGLVLVEALACRTPVVTTRGVDIWKELEQAGAVIADASPSAIADAVERATRNDSLGERGREWVLQNLDAARLAERYHAFYRQIVEEKR